MASLRSEASPTEYSLRDTAAVVRAVLLLPQPGWRRPRASRIGSTLSRKYGNSFV